jgi:histidinol-phosphate phosphatase family protein
MFKQLSPQGIRIDKIYFCPHKITDNCNCRKPKTGLIERAREDYENKIDFKNSFFIGDKSSDIKCGKDSGMRTILLKTGKQDREEEFRIAPDHVAKNLLEAADIISIYLKD